eukprot:4959156-Amphidinium_carterae.1
MAKLEFLGETQYNYVLGSDSAEHCGLGDYDPAPRPTIELTASNRGLRSGTGFEETSSNGFNLLASSGLRAEGCWVLGSYGSKDLGSCIHPHWPTFAFRVTERVGTELMDGPHAMIVMLVHVRSSTLSPQQVVAIVDGDGMVLGSASH